MNCETAKKLAKLEERVKDLEYLTELLQTQMTNIYSFVAGAVKIEEIEPDIRVNYHESKR